MMKTRWKRMLTGLLVIAMLIGLLPGNLQVAQAASVSMTPIASGTAQIGNKTKSGTWYQIRIGNKDAFCMDLHKSCASGDKYSAAGDPKYFTSSSDHKEDRVIAKMIYWYTEGQRKATKAFLVVQGLIWYVYDRDGADQDKYYEKDKIKAVIESVRTGTGCFPKKSAEDLYKDIFEIGDKVVTSSITVYTKENGSKGYQRLMLLDSSDSVQPRLVYSNVTVAERYRQRVRIHKQDDEGKPLAGVTFNLQVLSPQDYDKGNAQDDLYSFYVYDANGDKQGWTKDNDGDRGEFNLNGVTDANGNIGWLMVYRLENRGEVCYFSESDIKYNQEHGYIKKDGSPDIARMKQALIDEFDKVEGKDFPSDVTSKSAAEALAKTNLEEQKDKIDNAYGLKEISTGANDVQMDPDYTGALGRTFVLKRENSIFKNVNWPDEWKATSSSPNTDPWGDAAETSYFVFHANVTNKKIYRKASFKVVKKSEDPDYRLPLQGARYRLYGNQDCTEQALVSNNGTSSYKATPTYTTGKDGSFVTDYLFHGYDYWLKEIKAPEGYEINPDPIHIHVDMTGQTTEVVDELTTIETTDKPYYEKYTLVKKADKPENTYPLAGAEYKLIGEEYADRAKYYDANGEAQIGNPVYTTDAKGELKTDYLDPEENYWLEEIKAPEGYQVTSGKIKLEPNAQGENVVTHTEKSAKTYFGIKKEYCPESEENWYYITQLQHGTVDLYPEAGAEFQVWLAQYDSYDEAPAYARCKITTGEDGIGYSSYLIYGKYKVHQIKGSDKYPDAKFVKDFQVTLPNLNEDGSVYVRTYSKINYNIQAHLMIQKTCEYDGKTIPWTVAGAKYQIYKYNEHSGSYFATPLSQRYTDPATGKTDWADTFSTDKDGVVYTVSSLSAGRYKLVEVAAPQGTAYGEKTVEFTINKQNIETTQINGVPVDLVRITNKNHEQMGRFAVKKTGPQLSGYKDGSFVYENKLLKGAKFEVTAAQDIKNLATGETVIAKGTKVAEFTTGEKASFLVEHKGMTSSIDEDGVTWLTLPLGQYTVKEIQTAHGYLFPDKSSWDVSLTWDEHGQDTVLAKDGTDEKGVITVANALAGTRIVLHKEDATLKTPIGGAVFDLYTKDAIYNVDGDKIADADTKIATLTTDEDGSAQLSKETGLPFEKCGSDKNTGDYYLVETDVPASYLLDRTTRYPLHLEYTSDEEAVITAKTTIGNTQTTTKISKVDAAGSEELADCELSLSDSNGKVIASWISGREDSVKTDVDDSYINFSTEFDRKGNLILHGLHRDSEYTLTEKRPADGYATAESIVFKISAGTDDQGITSVVSVKQPDGSFVPVQNATVVMKDAKTQLRFTKLDQSTGDPLPGAQITVTDKDGKEVMTFTTTKEGTDITGVLVAGQTYTFTETKTPAGYVTAQAVKYTVQDTTKLQTVTMKDEKTRLRILKTDPSGNGVAGAKFTVTDKDGKEVMTFTSTDGGVDISGVLVAGQTYTFTETEAPAGYAVAAPVTYTVKDVPEVQTITVIDVPTEVHVSKRGMTGEEEVPGCKLKVTDKKGTVIDEWISGTKEHVITGKLVAGEEYILSETYPADGYTTANDVTFRVNEDGSVQRVIMKDAKTQIRFTKASESVSGSGIAGAQITVTDKDGKEVMTFTTTEEGTDITGVLSIGQTYTFTETKTPAGYVTAQAVAYTVQDTPQLQSVTMVDTKTRIRVVKKDQSTGNPLAGAKFTVTDKDGKEVMTFTSTEEGTDITGVLAVGQTYTFTETMAPEGYALAKPVSYTVKDVSEVQTITIQDAPVPYVTPSPSPAPDVPQTGRSQNTLLWLLILLAGITGLSGLYTKRRSHETDKDEV